MNYIAHIHIGAHTQTNLLGNFLGDFVKGSQLNHLPDELEQGIRLHRAVDSFTDSHQLILELKKVFPKYIRRMSGIVIDIYFDYLLMQNWQQYSKHHHSIIFEQFYLQLEAFSLPQHRNFCELSARLKSERWLDQYFKPLTCYRAFVSIEKRLNHKIVFADKAYSFMLEHAELFETTFAQFYPQCLKYSEKFTQAYHINP